MLLIASRLLCRYRLIGSALVALACAACAPSSLLTYQPDAPLSVTLPLAQAGVRDERDAFADVFARELQASRPDSPVETWMHLAGPKSVAADDRRDAIDRQFAARRGATSVLIVPGLFGDCVGDQSVPFGDGEVRPQAVEATASYAQYADLGLNDIRMVLLPGRASSASNGARLAAALRAEAARPGVEHIVLVAYSKGLPDALHALADLEVSGGLPRQLAALVSVAGVVMGTPLADHYEDLYDSVSRLAIPFGCTASQGGELASLTRAERQRWLVAHPPPTGLAYYSVVAYASPEETSSFMRSSQARLASIDPRNDGQVTVGDAILPRSVLLAAARADHWDLALPIDRYPNFLIRLVAPQRHFPREALFRATVKWVVGNLP